MFDVFKNFGCMNRKSTSKLLPFYLEPKKTQKVKSGKRQNGGYLE